MIMKGNPVIRCNHCGAQTEIPKDMFDDDAFPIGESGMGVQIQHDFFPPVTLSLFSGRKWRPRR